MKHKIKREPFIYSIKENACIFYFETKKGKERVFGYVFLSTLNFAQNECAAKWKEIEVKVTFEDD